MHWRCVLGLHRWGYWYTFLEEATGDRTSYSDCERPGCDAQREFKVLATEQRSDN